MARKTILVVDDDKDVCFLIKIRLEAAGKYTVVIANDGHEALEKAKEEPPRLIFLDVMMPDIDGFEVLRKLRGSVETKYTPIIMLTGKRDSDSMLRAEQLEATDYLMKPIDSGILMTLAEKHT